MDKKLYKYFIALGLGIAFGGAAIVARGARRRPASITITGLGSSGSYSQGSRGNSSQGSRGNSSQGSSGSSNQRSSASGGGNADEDGWSSSDEDDVRIDSSEEEEDEEDSEEEIEEIEEVREESSSMTHYAQDSEERMHTDAFEYGGGQAVRHDEFSYVWVPARLFSAADRKAARKAAKREAEKKARSRGRRSRPKVITVLQDGRGNAIGGLSIRGPDRKVRFEMTMGSRQRQRLDSIPEGRRERWHGWCAEQSVIHNSSVIRQRQSRNNVEETRRMFIGRCTITAYGRRDGSSTRYNEPKGACSTCRITNKMYDFDDDAFEASISSESSELP